MDTIKNLLDNRCPYELTRSIENQGLWEEAFCWAKNKGLDHDVFYTKELLNIILQYVDGPEFIILEYKEVLQLHFRDDECPPPGQLVKCGEFDDKSVFIVLADFEKKSLGFVARSLGSKNYIKALAKNKGGINMSGSLQLIVLHKDQYEPYKEDIFCFLLKLSN
jgi:hypothetical protein